MRKNAKTRALSMVMIAMVIALIGFGFVQTPSAVLSQEPDAADVVAFAIRPEYINPGEAVEIAWEVTGESFATLFRIDSDGEKPISHGLTGHGFDYPKGSSGTVTYRLDSEGGSTFRFVYFLQPTVTATSTPQGSTPTATPKSGLDPTNTPAPRETSTPVPSQPTATPSPTPTVTPSPTPNYCPPQVVVPEATPAFWEYYGEQLHLPLVGRGNRDCIETGASITATPTMTPIPLNVSFGIINAGAPVTTSVSSANVASPNGQVCLDKVGGSAVLTANADAKDAQICLTGSFPAPRVCEGLDCTSMVGFNEADGSMTGLAGDAELDGDFVFTDAIYLADPEMAFAPNTVGAVGSSEILSYTVFNLLGPGLPNISASTVGSAMAGSPMGPLAPNQQAPIDPAFVTEFIKRHAFAITRYVAGEIPFERVSLEVNESFPFYEATMQLPPKTPFMCDQASASVTPYGSLAPVLKDGMIKYRLGPVLFNESTAFQYCMWPGASPVMPRWAYIDFGRLMTSTNPELRRYFRSIMNLGDPVRATGVTVSQPNWQLPGFPQIAPPTTEQVFVFSSVTATAAGIGGYLVTGMKVSGSVVTNAFAVLVIPTKDLDCFFSGNQEYCRSIDS